VDPHCDVSNLIGRAGRCPGLALREDRLFFGEAGKDRLIWTGGTSGDAMADAVIDLPGFSGTLVYSSASLAAR
jgi:hypothetical protein